MKDMRTPQEKRRDFGLLIGMIALIATIIPVVMLIEYSKLLSAVALIALVAGVIGMYRQFGDNTVTMVLVPILGAPALWLVLGLISSTIGLRGVVVGIVLVLGVLGMVAWRSSTRSSKTS